MDQRGSSSSFRYRRVLRPDGLWRFFSSRRTRWTTALLATIVLGAAVYLSLTIGRGPHQPYVLRQAALTAACYPPCTAARIEAKLMRFSDLVRSDPSLAGLGGSDSNAFVWVVAEAGQATGYNGGSGWSYSIWLIKDEPGPPHVWGGLMGNGGYVANRPIVTWPSYWDSLPDYAAAR
jgi:hypothetical protein